MDIKQIPEGVHDTLPGEVLRKRKVEDSLRTRFRLCGYEEISPPVLEYEALYDSRPKQALVKTFDRQGSVLALRPEFTTSVMRIASTHLRGEPAPIRLCCIGVAFTNTYDSPGMQKEFTQAGAELLGLGGPSADAEIIALAASAITQTGLSDFLIDIGQVEFFKGLLEELGLGIEEAEVLRRSVEDKNALDMEMQLTRLKLGADARNRLMALPMLYGGPEVLEDAAKLTGSKRSLKALENLRTVYSLLCECGLESRLSIDLGLVHSLDYYTGIVFRGISGHLGFPLLSGGRYDGLGDHFAHPTPATGFAMGVEHLCEALESEHPPEVSKSRVDIVAGCTGGFSPRDYETVEELRAQGRSVELCYEHEAGQISRRALALGAKAVRLNKGEVQWL